MQTTSVLPRSMIAVGLELQLRESLGDLARGRVLVLDYFATQRCGVVVGDLTADFRDTPRTDGFVELASLQGVRVFAATRLLPVLADAGPTLRLAGPTFARHLAVALDRPERWM